MSTETFLRLPEEKRNRILDAAWEEFTRVRYTDVSINKIIIKARIPRGSFYQYFRDKEDLFAYLIGDVRDQVAGIFGSLLREAGGDLFETHLMISSRFSSSARYTCCSSGRASASATAEPRERPVRENTVST